MPIAQIEVSDAVYQKFQKLAEHLGEKDASKVFELCVDAAIFRANKAEAIKANKKFIEQCEDWLLHPSGFDESNVVMLPPEGKTEQEVHSLVASAIRWGDSPAILSCWKPTREHLDTIEETGRVWIACMGFTMPPIAVCAKNPIEFNGIDLL